MTSTLTDATDFIVQQAPDLVAGRIFEGREPATVTDPAVTVCDWMAPQGQHIYEQARPATEPQRFRVIARSADVQAARDLIGRIRDASWSYGGTFNGNRYLRTEPVSSVFPMEPPDANNRVSLGFLLEMKAAH